MKLFLCKKNKRCPAQTKRPLKRRKHKLKKKQTQEKHIFRFKASENENVKVDLHQR